MENNKIVSCKVFVGEINTHEFVSSKTVEQQVVSVNSVQCMKI